QYLALLGGAKHPALFDPAPVHELLSRLRGAGLLSSPDYETLFSGWEFLRKLSSRLRIVEGRSISDLDEEHPDLEALAKRLGYQSGEREGAARRALLEDYRRHTEAIRHVYEKVLG
ncbi:MAG: bifunctional [glutamate--ammonia ligase]-adenylyl-L-tyrosine phosphorylase/[glutamate--ammonia-ligase] adenylyltransferase, partial [Bdellovibrionota bacterium]